MSGPSGGALGDDRVGVVSQVVYEQDPDLARRIVQTGRYPRAGHDRSRWQSVDWDAYRAKVGVVQHRGPWTVGVTEARDGDLSHWISTAEHMPAAKDGMWYTTLVHAGRGLVMSDTPAEIAGSLPFLDYAEAAPRVLVGGLGLGIIPARLLGHARNLKRLDVVEIDLDIVTLIASDECAMAEWGRDPRLHIHHGDVASWWPPKRRARRGCLLHDDCWLLPHQRWNAAWMDIWDTISARNLPSMSTLTRRWTRRTDRLWCWERAECEAMRARGQTLEFPHCAFLGDGITALLGGPDDD